MPTMVTLTCTICGQNFQRPKKGKSIKKTCSDKCFQESKSRISSERMKRRRNGGDPALNAKLAEAARATLLELWKRPGFREAKSKQAAEALAAFHADQEAVERRNAKARRILERANARLRKETDFLQILADVTQRLMLAHPYDKSGDQQYTDYLREIITLANTDPELRAYSDQKMSAFMREEYARTHNARISENAGETQSEPDATTVQESAPDAP